METFNLAIVASMPSCKMLLRNQECLIKEKAIIPKDTDVDTNPFLTMNARPLSGKFGGMEY
jgi:hypothetical protein